MFAHCVCLPKYVFSIFAVESPQIIHKSLLKNSYSTHRQSPYVFKTVWASIRPISVQFQHCFRWIFYVNPVIFRFGTSFFQDSQLGSHFRVIFRNSGTIKTCGINRSRSVELVLKKSHGKIPSELENICREKKSTFFPETNRARQDSFK